MKFSNPTVSTLLNLKFATLTRFTDFSTLQTVLVLIQPTFKNKSPAPLHHFAPCVMCLISARTEEDERIPTREVRVIREPSTRGVYRSTSPARSYISSHRGSVASHRSHHHGSHHGGSHYAGSHHGSIAALPSPAVRHVYPQSPRGSYISTHSHRTSQPIVVVPVTSASKRPYY